MNESRLIYNGSDTSSSALTLLQSLSVFDFQNNSGQAEPQVVLTTAKFGKLLKKNLQLKASTDVVNVSTQSSDGFLVYKMLDHSEVEFLKLKTIDQINYKIYVLAHRLYHFSEIIEALKQAQISDERIILIGSKAHQKSFMHNEFDLKKSNLQALHAYEKILVASKAIKTKNETIKDATSWLPFFLLTFFRFLLAPAQILKNSRMLWLRRVYEFFAFLVYQKVHFVPIQNLFRSAFYTNRHIALMTTYKSYGLIVDSYYAIARTSTYAKDRIKLFGIAVFWKSRHFLILFSLKIRSALSMTRHILLMSYFKTYGLLVDSYYFLRHWVLMGIYKTYGLSVDMYYFTERNLPKILFPFLKIYWFSEFQYRKRIKKEFSKN